MTLVLGVLGWPIAHSRSPAMHGAAIAALGLDATYVPFAVRPEDLADAVRGLAALGVRGFNVTLPHKEAIAALLDEVEPDARAIGAVNTVSRQDGRWVGSNTDAPGLVRSLEEAGVALEGARVVVPGAAEVVVAARRVGQAEALVADLAGATAQAETRAVALDAVAEPFAAATLVLQATSATLDDGPAAEPFAASLPIDALPAGATVCDLVYRPRTTAVMRRAEARGLATVDGLGMLLWQGALAFERWTGVAPPVEAMRAALTAR